MQCLYRNFIWDYRGITFLKKGSSDGGATLCHCVTSPYTVGSHPRPPPSKDFYLIFSLIGRDLYTCRSFLLLSRPIKEKIKTEVLGKEFEEEPFFKRVFLNSSYKKFYKSITLKCRSFLRNVHYSARFVLYRHKSGNVILCYSFFT